MYGTNLLYYDNYTTGNSNKSRKCEKNVFKKRLNYDKT